MAILKEVFDWIENSDQKILWISGPAGAGKSAIAQTVAEQCAESSTLAASFFFFYGAINRNAAGRLISSIVYQLAIRMPDKRAQIGNIVEEDPSILHKPLDIQIEQLILPLFVSVPPNNMHAESLPPLPQPPYLVIIDGLDECQGDNSQRDIVRCIGILAHTNDIPLRFVIISRPEPQIEESFSRLKITRDFHSIFLGDRRRDSQTSNDIDTYFHHGFDKIYQKREIITEHFWPGEDAMSRLVYKAGGSFIYASSVLKYVDDDDFHPEERLVEILNTPPGLTPLGELDHLYRRIMRAYPNTERLLQVLTVICICTHCPSRKFRLRLHDASCSLCIQDIEFLLQLSPGMVPMVLRRMHSVLHISTSTHISFYHKSFMDFLHNRERAEIFFIEIKGGNTFIAQKLLQFLRGTGRTDCASLASPPRLPMAATRTPSLVDYATCNWYKHCRASGGWEEHPYLLEGVSAMLQSPHRLFPSVGQHNIYELIYLFQSFEVSVELSFEDSLTADNCRSTQVTLPFINTILSKSNINSSSTFGDITQINTYQDHLASFNYMKMSMWIYY